MTANVAWYVTSNAMTENINYRGRESNGQYSNISSVKKEERIYLQYYYSSFVLKASMTGNLSIQLSNDNDVQASSITVLLFVVTWWLIYSLWRVIPDYLLTIISLFTSNENTNVWRSPSIYRNMTDTTLSNVAKWPIYYWLICNIMSKPYSNQCEASNGETMK